MNKEQLQAIETRIDMSTMGPWFGNSNDDHMDWVETISGWVICTLPYSQTITPRIANRDFIAHARSDVPALLAEVRRQKKKVVWLTRQFTIDNYICPPGVNSADKCYKKSDASLCAQCWDNAAEKAVADE